MIDVKKLISGFLILAMAAVGSGLILSFVGNILPSNSSAEKPTINDGKLDLLTVSNTNNSVFVDTGSVEGNAAEMLADTDTTSTAAIANDSSNLTNSFANSFLNGLIAANPGGMSTDSSGNLVFDAPDADSVASSISSNSSIQNFSAPNWDAEASAQTIKTASGSSESDIAQYSKSLNAIFNKNIVSTNLADVIKGSSGDSAQATYIASQIQTTLNDLAEVPTPPSLVSFQKSLIKTLVYEKNFAQVSKDSNNDPIKSTLIVQAEESKYTSALNTLQTQMQHASALGLSFNSKQNQSSNSWIADILGIHTAHAIFGVGDITFDPATFGELVLNYVNDTVLQILKNTLVSLIQRKVLTWIQGSGSPRFVTDFGTQLVNSFQTAATNKISSFAKCIPSYQAPSVNLMLSTPATAQSNTCLDQFNGQLNNNLKNFYNHFDNFSNYLQLLQPGGNVWSLTVQVRDAAITAGGNSQSAQSTQTVAQQGWIGSSKCADGSNANTGSHYSCPDGGTLDGDKCDQGDGLIPTNAVLLANNGSCADTKSPKTTSPGQATGQGFFSSLKSGAENITSAKNIAGIIGALTSSLLNTLAESAINYSSNAVNGALSSGSSDSGITGISSSTIGTSSSSTSNSGALCSPSIQVATISTSTNKASASLSAGGGTVDSTCALDGNCPSTENSDGTPHYYWSAPGSLEAASGTFLIGDSLDFTYATSGTYTVTVAASTDNSSSTCEVDIQ